MRKIENLYAGIIAQQLCGGIDVEWARELSKKERYVNIKKDGKTVCFIDLTVLLAIPKEET